MASQEFLEFVKESNRKYIEAYNKRDYAGVQEIFAPDARIMPPGYPMIAAKDIPDFIKAIVSRGHHKINIETQEVFGPIEDTGVERTIVQFDTAEGKRKYNIKGLIYWKKIDGKWKIQCDCWNFDHPEALA